MQQGQGADRTFSWRVRVYYEDTDFGGVVYYANYLRYFERARTEWLRGARLDDLLDVTVELEEKKRTYVMLRQRALRGAEEMASARIQAACVRRDGSRPTAIPAEISQRMDA